MKKIDMSQKNIDSIIVQLFGKDWISAYGEECHREGLIYSASEYEFEDTLLDPILGSFGNGVYREGPCIFQLLYQVQMWTNEKTVC